MTRVLLFGSAPPPQGGIQQHCLRLRSYLHEQGYEALLLDYNRQNRSEGVSAISKGFFPAAFAVSRYRPDLVHSHTYHWRATLAIGLLRRFQMTKSVLTVHGESFFDGVHPWVLPSLKRAMRQFDAVIADNDVLRKWIVDDAGVDPDRVLISHAFLPPTAQQKDPELLPQEVQDFLKSHGPVLLVNGAVSTFRNQDKYGIRHAVQVAGQLRSTYKDLGLVFVATAVQHPKEQKSLDLVIQNSGLGDHLLVTRNLPEMAPLISACDVLLRPTATDGDSLIVRESLLANTPVVASDVVKRPEGVRCFPYGDVDAFAQQISTVLDGEHNPPTTAGEASHAGQAILDTYKRVLTPPSPM